MSRRWLPVCMGLVGILFGVAGCEGESDKETPQTPYQKFESQYSDAFCTALAPCCSLVQFNVGSCQEFFGLLVAFEAVEANEDLFTFYPDRAAQCLSDLKTLGVCGGDDPPSCNLVAEGKVAPGGACNTSVECMPTGGQPGYCELDVDGEGGHCLYPATPAAQGAACNEDCPADFAPCYGDVPSSMCFPAMGLECTNGSCQPFAPIGAACSGYDCAEVAYCTGGMCAARVGPGAACVDSDSCTVGNYCAAGLCTPQLPAGAACDEVAFSDQCLGGFCTYGHCMDFLLETLCAFGDLE